MTSWMTSRKKIRMRTRKLDYNHDNEQKLKHKKKIRRRTRKLKLQEEPAKEKDEEKPVFGNAIWQYWIPNTNICDLGTWVSYEKTLNNIFERAFFHGVSILPFIQNDTKYLACFHAMQQQRSEGFPGYAQPIRRLVQQSLDNEVASKESWISIPLSPFPDAIKVYEITQSSIQNSMVCSRDKVEYEFASSHFTRMLLSRQSQSSLGFTFDSHILSHDVVQVDSIVYENYSSVAQRYESLKESFSTDGKVPQEILVFHGTDVEAIQMIITGGFKVGGTGEVKIKNGTSHGSGVYTGTGPAAAVQYGRGSGRVILAKALVGNQVDMYSTSAGVSDKAGQDSWSPERDWMVFKDGQQLLPLYVIHFIEKHDFLEL